MKKNFEHLELTVEALKTMQPLAISSLYTPSALVEIFKELIKYNDHDLSIIVEKTFFCLPEVLNEAEKSQDKSCDDLYCKLFKCISLMVRENKIQPTEKVVSRLREKAKAVLTKDLPANDTKALDKANREAEIGLQAICGQLSKFEIKLNGLITRYLVSNDERTTFSILNPIVKKYGDKRDFALYAELYFAIINHDHFKTKRSNLANQPLQSIVQNFRNEMIVKGDSHQFAQLSDEIKKNENFVKVAVYNDYFWSMLTASGKFDEFHQNSVCAEIVDNVLENYRLTDSHYAQSIESKKERSEKQVSQSLDSLVLPDVVISNANHASNSSPNAQEQKSKNESSDGKPSSVSSASNSSPNAQEQKSKNESSDGKPSSVSSASNSSSNAQGQDSKNESSDGKISSINSPGSQSEDASSSKTASATMSRENTKNLKSEVIFPFPQNPSYQNGATFSISLKASQQVANKSLTQTMDPKAIESILPNPTSVNSFTKIIANMSAPQKGGLIRHHRTGELCYTLLDPDVRVGYDELLKSYFPKKKGVKNILIISDDTEKVNEFISEFGFIGVDVATKDTYPKAIEDASEHYSMIIVDEQIFAKEDAPLDLSKKISKYHSRMILFTANKKPNYEQYDCVDFIPKSLSPEDCDHIFTVLDKIAPIPRENDKYALIPIANWEFFETVEEAIKVTLAAHPNKICIGIAGSKFSKHWINIIAYQPPVGSNGLQPSPQVIILDPDFNDAKEKIKETRMIKLREAFEKAKFTITELQKDQPYGPTQQFNNEDCGIACLQNLADILDSHKINQPILTFNQGKLKLNTSKLTLNGEQYVLEENHSEVQFDELLVKVRGVWEKSFSLVTKAPVSLSVAHNNFHVSRTPYSFEANKLSLPVSIKTKSVLDACIRPIFYVEKSAIKALFKRSEDGVLELDKKQSESFITQLKDKKISADNPLSYHQFYLASLDKLKEFKEKHQFDKYKDVDLNFNESDLKGGWVLYINEQLKEAQKEDLDLKWNRFIPEFFKTLSKDLTDDSLKKEYKDYCLQHIKELDWMAYERIFPGDPCFSTGKVIESYRNLTATQLASFVNGKPPANGMVNTTDPAAISKSSKSLGSLNSNGALQTPPFKDLPSTTKDLRDLNAIMLHNLDLVIKVLNKHPERKSTFKNPYSKQEKLINYIKSNYVRWRDYLDEPRNGMLAFGDPLALFAHIAKELSTNIASSFGKDCTLPATSPDALILKALSIFLAFNTTIEGIDCLSPGLAPLADQGKQKGKYEYVWSKCNKKRADFCEKYGVSWEETKDPTLPSAPKPKGWFS